MTCSHRESVCWGARSVQSQDARRGTVAVSDYSDPEIFCIFYDTLHIMPGMQSIGDEIRKAREALDMTPAELARRAGIQRSHVGKIERGDNFTLETLEKIVVHLPNLPDLFVGSQKIRTGAPPENLSVIVAEHLEAAAALVQASTETQQAARALAAASTASARATERLAATSERLLKALEAAQKAEPSPKSSEID